MDIDNSLRILGYSYLGWANNWDENPKEVKNCKELKHIINDFSQLRSGAHHTVSCDICKYYYNYDSSG